MDSTPRTNPSSGHHALSSHEVLLVLETDPDGGLADSEARRRLHVYGPNELPRARSTGPLVRFLQQFRHPLIYVLLAAVAVTVLLGEYVDAAVIFAVVLINAVIGFVQESKAEAELNALRTMVQPMARVRRDGHTREVATQSLVPGDLVPLDAGDMVPADLRLLRLAELQADESALTGESVPVVKDEVALPSDTPVADRRNMVYAGTLVTSGTATGVVVATGSETELGEIHRLVGSADTLETPLTRRLAWFSKVLTVVILALALLTFGVGVSRGEPWEDMFTAAIALAVGAIPEGLPAAVTIALAIGVSRMARRKVVVRRLPAVETLGSTTVICTDKTGTLTQNQMTVDAVWTPHDEYSVTGGGYSVDGRVLDSTGSPARVNENAALYWALVAGAVCNDATLVDESDGGVSIVGDPTEAALIVVATKADLKRDRLRSRFERTETLPFASERQYMATRCHDVKGRRDVVMVKGSVERVLELCVSSMGRDGSAEELDKNAVQSAAERLAGAGRRVLATAVRIETGAEASARGELADSLDFTGLHAMLDPPQPVAAAAVRSCHEAGVTVKMITGDHAGTATAIARQVGLIDRDNDGLVVTGRELDALNDEELVTAADHALVFARVTPEQKLRLVQALQKRSHVVAMTGDGVNDAPALQQADIGVAMGLGGTEVAKEAADMVLLNDDFASLEAAVEEGRGVFDNITKFITWTLPTNMAEGLVILVAILVGTNLPILPLQILWINMSTAVLLGLTLAFEPKETGIMSRPPRDPHRPLLSRELVVRILLVSALLVGGTWWLYQWEIGAGASLAEGRTAALNLFVVVEAFYLLNCRSLTGSVWRLGFFSNRWILGGIALQAVGQLLITYVPLMNTIFDTAPIGLDTWLRIFALGAVASVVVAVDKRLRGYAV